MARAVGPRPASLMRISTLAIVLAVLAVLIGTVVVWAGFTQLLSARAQLFDRLQPAAVDVQQLGAQLVDQETGLRGYALTRDDRLLAPYRSGRTGAAATTTDLRAVFDEVDGGAALDARLDDVTAAMARWRADVAEPILAAPVPLGQVDEVFVASKSGFDEVRSELARLEAAVTTQRLAAREDLDQATTQLVLSVALSMAALAAVSMGGAVLLRRGVVRPIERLVVAADGVVLDRLDEPIAVDGPAEIAHLAGQVAAMRDRIVAELAVVEAARRDIDAWAAELARSNDDLEQFAYVASHDLQEPLRKVASFCQLLEQRYGDQLDERGLTYLAFAVDGAKRMQALIADLLDFSRVGRNGDAFVACDLGAIAREVVDQEAEVLGDGQVTIGDLPTVTADPVLWRALLANLVGNAAKYRSPDRPLVVDLRAERGDAEWILTCTDNGIGVEPRFRERVFVIFQRLHTADRYDGTGIGLALCRKIVEFHGGQIWIEEPPGGVGTSVRWTVPLLASPHRTGAHVPTPSPPTRIETP